MKDNKIFVINEELKTKESYRRAFKNIGVRLDTEFFKRSTAIYLRDNFNAYNKWYEANYKRFTNKKWSKLINTMSGYLFNCFVCEDYENTIEFAKESQDLYSIKESYIMFLAFCAIKQLYGQKWATPKNAELVVESLFFNNVISYKKMNDNSLKYVVSRKQLINMFDVYCKFNFK